MTAAFYRDDDDAPLQQGDVLLAPYVRLVAPESPTAGDAHLFSVSVPVDAPDAELVSPVAQVGWAPVMVVSHDCQLDKDFNRRYQELRRQQVPKRQAVEEAEADGSLDRWLVVCPLVTVPASDGPRTASARAAHEGRVVGALGVPGNPGVGISDSYVDLTSMSTIDRQTVTARLASLTDHARLTLRLALARTVALRTPEVGFIVEDLVGDRIEAVRRSQTDPMVVEIRTRRNGTVSLLAQPGEPPTGGPSRSRASAP